MAGGEGQVDGVGGRRAKVGAARLLPAHGSKETDVGLLIKGSKSNWLRIRI